MKNSELATNRNNVIVNLKIGSDSGLMFFAVCAEVHAVGDQLDRGGVDNVDRPPEATGRTTSLFTTPIYS
jgi:hypothetical protein